jgi:hypothetical protein
VQEMAAINELTYLVKIMIPYIIIAINEASNLTVILASLKQKELHPNHCFTTLRTILNGP